MRVLLSTESYLPYLSGVTVSVDALARGLGARGHEVLVLAPRPPEADVTPDLGSPGPEPRYAWLPSYQLPRMAPPLYRMPFPHPGSTAVRAARRFAPHVVHAHSPFVSGQLARSVARGAHAPLVFTHHTRFGDYGHYLGPLSTPGSRLADAYLRRWWIGCDAIIAPSADLAAEIRSRLPVGRDRPVIRVIPTGVDVGGVQAMPAPDLRAAHGWGPETVIVASLGRLAPEKSPSIILEAVARALVHEPELRLIVIGDGASLAELRARAAADDLRGRVHFTGRLARAEALRTLTGADLFVFSSRTETQGLVLAEALAAGLPTIALDGPGVRDSVRDGIDGVVVPHVSADIDVDALATALARLAHDRDLRTWMASAALTDAGRFAVERRVGETEALYHELRPASAP
jgi:glycosyltransferase involved in cell wall biosynthesis